LKPAASPPTHALQLKRRIYQHLKADLAANKHPFTETTEATADQMTCYKLQIGGMLYFSFS
jgi:hypothetical protein